jgi:hypothetical protein
MKHGDKTLFNENEVPSERPLPPGQLRALKADVLRRIRRSDSTSTETQPGSRPRRARGMLPAVVALIAGIACGALTTAFAMADPGAPRADAKSLTMISTRGEPVPLTTRSQRALDSSRRPPRARTAAPQPTGEALLMGQRGPTAFFRIPLKDGNSCFGTGRRDGEAYDVLGFGCWDSDPRAPIHDLSPIQAGGPGGFQVLQIHGFAADGVKTIAVTDLNGSVIAETTVEDNVYKITAYPPGGVSALLALDEGENVLQRVAYRR